MIKNGKAPFPAFGGKSTVAELVWSRFGQAINFVAPAQDGLVAVYDEPFANSAAILLQNPAWDWENDRWVGRRVAETINDLNPFIANFWRALRADPDGIAEFADWPVNEADLHARHAWLVRNGREWFRERMLSDPDFYDTKIGGWWVWGINCWIGRNWCNLNINPSRQLPALRRGGGSNRIHDLGAYFQKLSARLRQVRVTCGDWKRVLGRSATYDYNGDRGGITAIFLDPPYGHALGRKIIYNDDEPGLAESVRDWCLEEMVDPLTPYCGRRCNHPRLRIALCGYGGEHEILSDLGWERVAWTTVGGYGNQRRGRANDNRHREVIWFSPGCIRPGVESQMRLL